MEILSQPFYLVTLFAMGLISSYLVTRLMSRWVGFTHAEVHVKSLGPPLFTYRWRRVSIGWTTWNRTVHITGYQTHLHLKLIVFVGGGEMLIPLQDAQFKFSENLLGEHVDITVKDKTYGFGPDIAEMVKQHYSA